MSNEREGRIAGYIAAGVLTILVVLVIWVGYKTFGTPPAILIPTVGLLVFFGVLIVVNLFSKSPDLQKGEVRKAVAASLLAVYFFIIAVALFAPASPIYKVPQTNLVQGQATAIEDQDTEEEAEEESSVAGEAAEADVAEEGSEAEEGAAEEGAAEAAGPTTANDIVNGLLNNFTKLIMVVVGFYFGGRSAEEIVKIWKA